MSDGRPLLAARARQRRTARRPDSYALHCSRSVEIDVCARNTDHSRVVYDITAHHGADAARAHVLDHGRRTVVIGGGEVSHQSTGELVALVLCMGTAGDCPGTWQFVLRRRTGGSTRLLIRGRSGRDMPFFRRLPDLLMDTGSLTMERKMLLGIKARAERRATPGA